MYHHSFHFTLALSGVWVIALLGPNRHALGIDPNGSYDVVVTTGAPIPGGNGTFSGFPHGPVMNDLGQIAFEAEIMDQGVPDGSGIFRFNGRTIDEITRSGSMYPSGGGQFFHFTELAIANTGDVVVAARTDSVLAIGRDTPMQDLAILRGNGDVLTEMIRSNRPVTEGDLPVAHFSIFVINQRGDLAVSGAVGPPGDRFDALFTHQNGQLEILTREGDPAPGIDDVDMSIIGLQSINDSGQIAFNAFLETGQQALFFYDGNSITPIDVGQTGRISTPHMNDSGQITMDGVSGLWVFQKDRAPVPVLGGPGPDRYSRPIINNAGHIATSGSQGLSVDLGTGLFPLANVLVDTGIRPSGGFGLNNRDELFFKGFVSEGGQAIDGMFIYDEVRGVTEIIRVGDELDGSEILSLAFFSPGFLRRNPGSSYNDMGQLAFGADLADGRQVIVLYTPVPEPSGWCLAVACLLGWLTFLKR